MGTELTIQSRDTQYIARISHGKDSLKMLDVIVSRGLPLDRITTTDVWATDTIRGEHPKMVEFKARADEYIWRKYRIEVEHLCAMRNGEKVTYEKMFYHIPKRRPRNTGGYKQGTILGFPMLKGPWCQKALKVRGSANGLPSTKRGMVSKAQAYMTLDQIERRLEDAIKNGTEADVNYWRGYRDAAVALMGAQPNEPLTLEELQGMHGKRVWVDCMIYTGWGILEIAENTVAVEICSGCSLYVIDRGKPIKRLGAKLYRRLAAYEDTGLEPEEVSTTKAELALYVDAFNGVKFERIMEIARAEKAGRLVVLPCNVRDMDGKK